MISLSGTSVNSSPSMTPFRYLIGFPVGSWIMRNEIASSVETAECIFTGMMTRLRRRLPDQSEAGMGDYSEQTLLSRMWELLQTPQVNKARSTKTAPASHPLPRRRDAGA